MMGAGGFIKNPGWEILSTDDIMEDDYEAVVATFLNDGNDFELNSEVILFLPPTDEEMEEEEFGKKLFTFLKYGVFLTQYELSRSIEFCLFCNVCISIRCKCDK